MQGRARRLEALGHEVGGEHAPEAARSGVGAPLQQGLHRRPVPMAHRQVQGRVPQGRWRIHKSGVHPKNFTAPALALHAQLLLRAMLARRHGVPQLSKAQEQDWLMVGGARKSCTCAVPKGVCGAMAVKNATTFFLLIDSGAQRECACALLNRVESLFVMYAAR